MKDYVESGQIELLEEEVKDKIKEYARLLGLKHHMVLECCVCKCTKLPEYYKTQKYIDSYEPPF